MHPPVAVLLLLLLGVVSAGCSGGGVTSAAPTDAASAVPAAVPEGSSGIDPALLEPLTALGPCPEAPTATADEVVDGLVLPEGAVLTSVTRTDPVVTVQGWVPLTPIQFRVGYADRDDVELLSIEDEVWEAEVLATVDGEHRLFLKAQAACEAASIFIAVVAPEEAADAVPVPQGG